ncbi:Enoyl-CoA hydratase [Altererythrobacter epoxidivorans]|uniref:Enoyl-CoA hydratase n=1 Tax=Altererythrobacter epoxidivorans TaxID=361183 RepID=A0A0M3T9X1_9SPHN|nr:enoyl-CoA hydratase-related protein [Altererythrobacter epoxidivorans]ALE16052.1 Enoyl-CoA hydratase [Altererythrobacter epoxidivorans]
MSHLELEVADGIALIRFDNPPLQVMTPQTMNELNAMLPRLQESDVRAVVFTGNAKSGYFIRHFSVEELDDNTRGENAGWDRSMDDVLWDIEHLPVPVIAAIEGSAWGGGLEFALACDIRVAKDGDWRFGLPEVSVGILPGGGGTQRLTEVVGRGKALEMMLRPTLVDAAEAFRLGIFEQLVERDSSDSALDRAMALARDIASRSPHAVRHIKHLVRSAQSPVQMDDLREESRRFADLLTTEEAKQGLSGAAANHRAERKGQ